MFGSLAASRVPRSLGAVLVAALSFAAESLPDVARAAPSPTPSRPEPAPTVLVLALEARSSLSEIGYSFSLRMLEILRDAGGANLVHPKMLARVESRYDHRLQLLSRAERRTRLGRILGASHVLHGQLDEDELEIRLTLSSLDGQATATEDVSAEDFEALLDALPQSVVRVMKKGGLLDEAVIPEPRRSVYATRHRQAMLDHAACHRPLMNQPMGIGTPIVVDEAAIRIAMDACRVAVERDQLFASAKADLALAHAFLGERKAAEHLLIELKDTPGFHPSYWLARFWILSRYYDIDLGLESMREAIELHPGFMLGRGYLGEALLAVDRPREARAVFEDYLARCPRQSYVMGRIGLALERSGAVSAAIDWTERALKETPGDPELLYQKANRLISAGHPEAAIPLLAEVVSRGGARASVHARLGRARMNAGELEGAERALRMAIEKASGPSGWRTRNEARYDLARLWMRTREPENAIRQIRRSLLEGYVDRRALTEKPLARLQKRSDFKALRKVTAIPGIQPRYVSPLGRVTASGRLEVRSRFERRSDRKVLERL